MIRDKTNPSSTVALPTSTPSACNDNTIAANAIASILQVVASAAVLFLLYRYLVQQLGIQKLGIWSLLLASVSLARLSELGMSAGVTRFVARELARGEGAQAAGIVETAQISLGIGMGILILLVYPAMGWLLHLVIPDTDMKLVWPILPAALISIWVTAQVGIVLGSLEGCQRIVVRSLLMTVSHVILLMAALAFVPRWGLVGLAWGQVGQNLMLLIGGGVILRRIMPEIRLAPRHWNKKHFRALFSYGVQFQVAGWSMVLYDPLTKALISHFGGLSEVGWFEMASQMIAKLRALFISGVQVLVPVVATLGEEADSLRLRLLYSDTYQLVLYLALPFFAGIVALAPFISIAWLGRLESSFVAFGAVLSAGWFLNVLNSPSYFANVGSGSLRWNTVGHVVIGAVNIVFGIVLGRAWGGIGVVTAWAVALALGSTFIMVAFHKGNRIRLGELFPPHFGYLALTSLTSALIVLPFGTRMAAPSASPTEIALVLIIAFVILVGPSFWFHPMRRRISRWAATRIG